MLDTSTTRLAAFFHHRPFPRPFWFLVTGSFVNKAGNFIMPFFALYLTGVHHLTISATTLIISLMGLGSLGAGICGGMVSDYIGRRTTLLFSLIATATLMLALGFAQSLPLMIPLAILYQFCNELFRPVTSATIADLVPSAEHSRAYGLSYWANNIGNGLGPIIAGLIAPVSYLILFLGDAVTTYSFSLLVWFGVPETRPGGRMPGQKHQAGRAFSPLPLRSAFTDPWLWAYALLGFLFDSVYVQWTTTLPLDMHAHGLSTLAFGTVAAVNAAAVVLISLPLSALFRRTNKHVSLIVAALMLGTGMGLYFWLHTYPGYILGTLFWTTGEILCFPIVLALIADLSPPHLRGSYQGIYSSIRALSSLLAPMLGGVILEHAGSGALWSCCFVLSALIAGGYLILYRLRHAPLIRPSQRGC
jgi:MFS family permease